MRPKKYITIKKSFTHIQESDYILQNLSIWVLSAQSFEENIVRFSFLYFQMFRMLREKSCVDVEDIKMLDNQIQISRCSECWAKKIKDNCHHMCHISYLSHIILYILPSVYFWKEGDHLFVIISWLEQSALLLFMRF